MLFRFNDLRQVFGYNSIYLLSLFDKVLRCPFGNIAMRGSKMLLCGRVAMRAHIAGVNSNALQAAVDFNFGGVIEQLYFLADIVEGHAVIMFICAQADMIIFHYRYD